jgi:hypothetical protein
LLQFDFADCGVGRRPFGASSVNLVLKNRIDFLAVHA